eukprot:GFKZ01004596.1.p1 GENE.GFKZ01004596.1~~GFKZ01004596.1.p1  ORF type:complete len:402 (-),score=62.73 GFKZ01004596.1:105-1187(-)
MPRPTCFTPTPLPLRLFPRRHSPFSTSSFLAHDEIRIARHSRRAWAPKQLPPRATPTLALDIPNAIAKKLDGKATAATVRAEVAAEVTSIVAQHGEEGRPGLAVVIVGDRKDSQTYVRSKRKACEEVGIRSFGFELPSDVTQERVEAVVDELNGRADVDGILVQLPLPAHIDDEKVLDRIRIEKDVDGFHPLNIGRLCMSGRTPPLFIPCTPKGCVDLLDRYGVEIEGKNVVVIGRSNIVGLPVAMLLLHRNATVTICHSRTKDTEAKVRDADILVAACGIPNFVKSDWLKEGVVIVDVGINAVDDPTKKRGYRLVGDVDYSSAAQVASYITPVPGGVGPMTIAMLLKNTVSAAKRRTDQ